MELKKQLGGKRKGAGRKPVLSKKIQISLYVEGVKIIKFGSEEEMKTYLYNIIDNFNKDGLVYSQVTPNSYDGKKVDKIIYDEPAQWAEPAKKVMIKRTPAHWVELRRDCQTPDDYAKWLEDLESDTFLTTREKSQIKQTV